MDKIEESEFNHSPTELDKPELLISNPKLIDVGALIKSIR